VGRKNIPKKHHYNPNFILKRFVDPQSNVLWVFDKQTQKCHPVKGTKTNDGRKYDAFAENHYNRIVDRHGNIDLSIEQHLTEIESNVAPIIDLIVRASNASVYPSIGLAKIEKLARFCHVQHMRSPATRGDVKSSEASHQEYQDILNEYSIKLGMPPDLLRSQIGDIDEMMDYASKMLVMLKEYPGCPVDIMVGMNLDVARIIEQQQIRFITSDRPCVVHAVLQSGGMVFLPISADTAIQFSRPEDSNGTLHTKDLKTIEVLNKQTFDNALRFVAGCSREYLEALAHIKRDEHLLISDPKLNTSRPE